MNPNKQALNAKAEQDLTFLVNSEEATIPQAFLNLFEGLNDNLRNEVAFHLELCLYRYIEGETHEDGLANMDLLAWQWMTDAVRGRLQKVISFLKEKYFVIEF